MREHRIPRSGDARVKECRMPFIGPLKGRESRIPRSGDTQRGKNVAYFFSDRSRALAKAIVLKRQDDILFK